MRQNGRASYHLAEKIPPELAPRPQALLLALVAGLHRALSLDLSG